MADITITIEDDGIEIGVGSQGEQMPAATKAEAEAGTGTGLRAWSPLRIAQAIAALAAAAYAAITHAEAHATGGDDELTPAAIGASPAGHDHDDAYEAAGAAAEVGAALLLHAGDTGNPHGVTLEQVGAQAAMTAASQAEMEAGTEEALRSMSPLRVAQAIAALGGGLSGTGAVDNAVLRADGTGGETLQSSDLSIEDAATATQANVALTNQHAGQTHSALVLAPKGTGAFIAGPKPDGTATGGNARGANAVDLTMARTAAANVASGEKSVAIGYNAKASGEGAFAVGSKYGNAVASATDAVAINQGTATASYAVAVLYATASKQSSLAFGYSANTRSVGEVAFGGLPSPTAKQVRLSQGGATTTSTNPASLLINNISSWYHLLEAGTSVWVEAVIVGRQATGKCGITKIGALLERTGNATRLVGSAATLVAWAGDAELGTPTIAITADDTNEAISVTVTPANNTSTSWACYLWIHELTRT